MRSVTIGLLGCGTVGGGFVSLLEREHARIGRRYGLNLSIGRILVREAARARAGIDRARLTTSAVDVIDHCDLAVELVGGVNSAGAYVRRALSRGCDVVTANKALLADRGAELFELAARHEARIGFEASVCGGLPIIRALGRGLAGDSIDSIEGILNGTCNYVLTRMEEGLDFDDALRDAQRLGFAEADPSLDVDGSDAAQKLQILAELAFDLPMVSSEVMSLRGVTRRTVTKALSRGRVIRQIATAERRGSGVMLRVATQEIPRSHALASVRNEMNGVVIRGRAVGEVLLVGRGAGSMPTAAAVLSDVVELAVSRPSSSHYLT